MAATKTSTSVSSEKNFTPAPNFQPSPTPLNPNPKPIYVPPKEDRVSREPLNYTPLPPSNSGGGGSSRKSSGGGGSSTPAPNFQPGPTPLNPNPKPIYVSPTTQTKVIK